MEGIHNEEAVDGGELAAKVLRMTSKTNMTETAVKAVTKLVNEIVPDTAVPTTTKGLRHTLDIEDNFVTLPMCGGCKKVYDMDVPDVCKNTRYDGTVCNAVKPSQNILLAFQPLTYGLGVIIPRIENFLELCNLWRKRESGHVICDVYEGHKWASMIPWLDEEGYTSLLLQFNIDWFCPYTNVPYSFGAIYATILNLPREIRFKEENVLIVGCIPGPCEPKKGELNEIMDFFVDDLIECESEFFVDGHRFRARLYNSVSDLPATRASMGLAGHAADQGCSKCHSALLHGGKTKIGVRRNHMDHLAAAEEIRSCNRSTGKAAIATRTGYKVTLYDCRDAAILKLVTFKPVNDHVVDTMHALCSGVGRTLKNLIEPDYNKLRHNLTSAGAPTTLISQCHTSLTSSQVKELYEFYAHSFLGAVKRKRHLDLIFILKDIMMLLMARSVTETDLDQAEELIRKFLESFVRSFGEESVVPNMHMMIHIPDDVRRFGPSPNNWCFPYERYNRTLKNVHTNNKNIAPQVMRRESTLSQTLEKSTVVLSEKINPNQRQEYLIQTPLMTVEHVYKLKMLRRKKTAVSLEVREAVYKYLAENDVDAVHSLAVISELSFIEVLRPGVGIVLKDGEILIIDRLVLANEAYVVIVGCRLYDEKAAIYKNLIRQWQFKSGVPSAISPHSVTNIATISSKIVDGVHVFTSETRPSSYFY